MNRSQFSSLISKGSKSMKHGGKKGMAKKKVKKTGKKKKMGMYGKKKK